MVVGGTRRRGRTLRPAHEAMIAVADAAYRALLEDDEGWLEAVLGAALPVLDQGSFVHGWIVDMRGPGFRACAALRLPPGADLERHVRHRHPEPGDADMAPMRLPGNLFTLSSVYAPRDVATKGRLPPGFGLRDGLGFTAMDPSGIGCALVGALTSVRHVLARDVAQWNRVSAHVGAALRLREHLRLRPAEASLDAADAILAPRGQLVHERADLGADRLAVEHAAEALASRHGDGDPERRLAAWRALVAGRWSLVDTIDTDQKRFFVLRKNAPSAPGPPLLSENERAIAAYVAMGHSQKAIAYHLGLAESAVSRAVAGICARLGVRNRAELAQLASALHAHPEAAS